MRKGVKLAGLLAAGVAAFVVACSPVCTRAGGRPSWDA